jgi:hypothetical protein
LNYLDGYGRKGVDGSKWSSEEREIAKERKKKKK